jgi:hypothetical protein
MDTGVTHSRQQVVLRKADYVLHYRSSLVGSRRRLLALEG